MAGSQGAVYAANHSEGTTSAFYRELVATIDVLNKDRERPYTLRQAITQGLGLTDGFAGKIRNGSYVPTLDKLESLAKFLGVAPYIWDTYVRRYAEKEIRRSSEPMIDMYRVLARLPESAADELVKAMTHRGREVLASIGSNLRPAA